MAYDPLSIFFGFDPLRLDDQPQLEWVASDMARRAYRMLPEWSSDDVLAAGMDLDAALFEWTVFEREAGNSAQMLKRHYEDLDDSASAPRPHQYFAVLTLRELAAAAATFSGEYDWTPPPMDWPSFPEKILIEALVCAMESICFAEELVRRPDVEQEIAMRNRKAARASREPFNKIRALTLSLYTKREWPSKAAAAREIYPVVAKRAQELGRPLSEQRGQKTVYDWICKHSASMYDSALT